MPPGERAALVARHRNNEAGRQLLAARLRLLTRREKAVLDALASGLTPAAMAAQSHNSTATIRNQIHSILTKLEVNSQVEAIAIAHRHLRPMPASRA
jgi:DNA-binding NarL/FixJ family response regulator